MGLERAQLTGFASRMKALHRLSAKEEAIYFTGYFYNTVLLIECAPILVKLHQRTYTFHIKRLDMLEKCLSLSQSERSNTLKIVQTPKIQFETKTAGYRISEMINAGERIICSCPEKEKRA